MYVEVLTKMECLSDAPKKELSPSPKPSKSSLKWNVSLTCKGAGLTNTGSNVEVLTKMECLSDSLVVGQTNIGNASKSSLKWNVSLTYYKVEQLTKKTSKSSLKWNVSLTSFA